MNRKHVVASLIVILVGVVALVVSFRHDGPSIAGRWQTEAPSSLVFEFSGDGAVFLVDDAETRQVFRYKLISNDMIELYDGMGRIRRYRVAVGDNTMAFLDPESGLHIERYSRISNDG